MRKPLLAVSLLALCACRGSDAFLLPGVDLARGAELFARHCAVCHGTDGEADGAAAPLLHPRARRFSSGRFRLASTVNGVAADADLIATLQRGMPGSAMPAWTWMPEQDLCDLAAQVRRLALTGVRERLECEALADGRPIEPRAASERAHALLAPGDFVHVPDEPARDVATLAHGRVLFEQHCAACHGLDGRGRAPETLPNEDGGLDWARDFGRGALQGGGSFEALATRVRVGMPGSAMPGFASLRDVDVAALTDFVQTMVPPGAADALVHRHERVVARRTRAALPDDPGAPGWSEAQELDVVLAPLLWHDDAVLGAKLAALHDGERIAVRLRWRDATRDDEPALDSLLVDACALALSDEVEPPLFGMGSREHPVNLWHWKAARGVDARGVLDLLEARPHLAGDPLFGESRSDAAPEYLPAPTDTQSGGAPVGLSAEGFQALRALERRGATIAGAARWVDGEWSVVLTRALGPRREREVALAAGAHVLLAVAVWDGAGGDRGGCKSISIWQRLELAP